MTLEQASAAVALVSAVAAIAVTVFGVFERKRAFAAQQDDLERQAVHWAVEFAAERRRQEVLLRTEFHLEQYRHRLASYTEVIRTLGAVSDVNFESDVHKYETLLQNKELLQATAAALYDHLYGAPGLLMTMNTRNYLHGARRQCLDFLNGGGDLLQSGDRLVNAFYHARRYLRADLELMDDRTPENLETLATRLGVMETDSSHSGSKI